MAGYVVLVRNLSQCPYPFYALKGGVWTLRRQSSPRLHLAFHDRRKIGLRAVGQEKHETHMATAFLLAFAVQNKIKVAQAAGIAGGRGAQSLTSALPDGVFHFIGQACHDIPAGKGIVSVHAKHRHTFSENIICHRSGGGFLGCIKSQHDRRHRRFR